MANKPNTVFDEYLVDCLECAHYWDDSCDGACGATERSCTAFKAVRRVDIPEQIESLRSEIKGLKTQMLILAVWAAIMTVVVVFL